MPVSSASEAWRMRWTSARDSSEVIQSRRFAGCVLPRLRGRSELAVERQRGFQRDEGLLRANPAREGFVEVPRFFFHDAGEDFDAGGAQAVEAACRELTGLGSSMAATTR